MRALDRLARRLFIGRLERLKAGTLTLDEAGATRALGPGDGPAATIVVRNARFYRAVALGGHLGAVEAYLDRWWETDDLTALVRLMVRNREVLDSLELGVTRLLGPLRRGWHGLHRNTRRGSRRNIAAHYDLGNDFFATFLDDTLTYSCGIFEDGAATLHDASIAKYDRICRKLELRPDDHVVEIGTGWGGFALHAAHRYGCRVTRATPA